MLGKETRLFVRVCKKPLLQKSIQSVSSEPVCGDLEREPDFDLDRDERDERDDREDRLPERDLERDLERDFERDFERERDPDPDREPDGDLDLAGERETERPLLSEAILLRWLGPAPSPPLSSPLKDN